MQKTQNSETNKYYIILYRKDNKFKLIEFIKFIKYDICTPVMHIKFYINEASCIKTS